MKIVVISDTHCYEEIFLDNQFSEEVKDADLLIHCGDFVSEKIYQHFFYLMKGKIMAVCGNSDSGLESLPNFINTELAGYKVMIMHGHQAPTERLYRFAPEADLIIFGHQHHPEYYTEQKPYMLNPGSLNNNRYLAYNSFAVLELEKGLEPHVRFVKTPKQGRADVGNLVFTNSY